MTAPKRTGRLHGGEAPRRPAATYTDQGTSDSDKSGIWIDGDTIHFDLKGVPEGYFSKNGATDENVLRDWILREPDPKGEQEARCPLHDDRTASASINFRKSVWHCFKGCPDGHIGELLYRMAFGTSGTPPKVRRLEPAKYEELSEAKVEGWHGWLISRDDPLDRLREQRGITLETVERFRVGYDKDRRRYTFPVYDENGALVNVRRYRLGRRGRAAKWLNTPGHGSPVRLYPSVAELPVEGRVFVVEGELDALVLWQASFPAVTSTHGAPSLGKVVAQNAELFAGREVVVWTDHDEVGREARGAVVKALGSVAEVRVLEPYADEPEDGQDASDLLMELGADAFAERVAELADAAPVVAAPEPTAPPVPGAPVPDDYEVPYPWEVREDGVYSVGKEGEASKFAHAPLLITERWVDDEGTEALRLAWTRDGRWRDKVYDRDDVLVSRNVSQLAADGAPVGATNERNVARYLMDLEAANLTRIPVRQMTRRLGWVGEAEDFVANLDDTAVEFHGLPGTEELAEAFRRSGSLAGWQRAVSVLEEHPRAALGIYASLAAPLLRIVGAPPFTVDWSGETSLGKTTTLKIGASVWGSPALVRSWDATPVAIEHLAGTLFGLPLLLDETKRARSPQHVAEVIYAVAQGLGRGRGARGGGLRDTPRWSTIVLSTGEQPITTFTQDGGTRGRVVSSWGSPFGDTRDARMVRTLTRQVSEHYGHAGPAFMEHVLASRNDWPRWQRRYDDITEELTAHSDNPVVQRRAALVAVLRMAAGLAKRSGVLPWAPPFSFWPTLLESGAGSEDDDQARVALGEVHAWAAAHERRFASFSEHHYYREAGPRGWAGRWDSPSEELCLLPDLLRSLFKERDHEYVAMVKSWADRNWIRPDSQGKNTRMTRLDGSKNLRMVVIRAEAVQWLGSVGPEGVPAPLEEGHFPPENDEDAVL